jgi:hypothetical protein
MKSHLQRHVFFKRLCNKVSTKILFLSFWVPLFLINEPRAFSQDGWKLGLGNSNTQFKFLNSKGLPVTFLKQGSGNSIFISAEKTLLDSSIILGQTTERAVYFLNHPLMLKFLTHTTYEMGINFNQYNAVGDVQKITMNYQTNYLGIFVGGGPYIYLTKGIYLSLKGIFSLQKISQGTQQVNNQFMDLMQESDFNQWMYFAGYSGTLTKKLTNGLSLFVQAQQSRSYNPRTEGEENLNFSALNVSFGLKIEK